MDIAFDISPLSNNRSSQNKVRGTGFYIENLKDSLLKYFPENNYIFFSAKDKLDKNIDLIHYPYFEIFFRSLPLNNKHKTIVTAHDLTPLVFQDHFPSGIRGKVKWEMQKFALKKVDAIITDSKCSKKDIVKFTGIEKDKINVIYLAVDNQFKKIQVSKIKAERLQNTYKLPEKFVLYVGDATWNKNLLRLIDAINICKIPLVMVGKALTQENIDPKNPWNKDLIQVQKILKENKLITRLGFIPTEDLANLYNLATALVMPSLYEGFGLPALEAMSCSCPVILSREGSLPEIAEDAAYYINAYDSKNIAEGIREVVENINLQNKLSEKSLNQAKKFNWQKTAQETIDIYKRTLNK